jgi:hypothetical protein
MKISIINQPDRQLAARNASSNRIVLSNLFLKSGATGSYLLFYCKQSINLWLLQYFRKRVYSPIAAESGKFFTRASRWGVGEKLIRE